MFKMVSAWLVNDEGVTSSLWLEFWRSGLSAAGIPFRVERCPLKGSMRDGDSGTSDANWRGWGLMDTSPESNQINSIPAEGCRWS